MNISRILTLPLILGTLLSMQPCHAWRLLPTRQEITFTVVASIGTFAALRRYYLDQENRIRAELREGNDRLYQQTQYLQQQITDAQAATHQAMQDGANQIVDAVQTQGTDTRLAINHSIGSLRYDLNETVIPQLDYLCNKMKTIGQAQQLNLPSTTALQQLIQGPDSSSSAPSSRRSSIDLTESQQQPTCPETVSWKTDCSPEFLRKQDYKKTQQEFGECWAQAYSTVRQMATMVTQPTRTTIQQKPYEKYFHL